MLNIKTPVRVAIKEVNRYVKITCLPLRFNSPNPSKRRIEQVIERKIAGEAISISPDKNTVSTGPKKLSIMN